MQADECLVCVGQLTLQCHTMGWNCLNCLKIGCQTSISVAEMLPKTKADWLPMHKMTDLWCGTKTKKTQFWEKGFTDLYAIPLSCKHVKHNCNNYIWSNQNTRILWLSKKTKQRQQQQQRKREIEAYLILSGFVFHNGTRALVPQQNGE